MSRYHGSKVSWSQHDMELNLRWRRRERERQKRNRFISAKQQLWTCIMLFGTFLRRRCTTATWNFLISRARFMEKGNTAQKLLLFLNFDTVLSDSIPEKFANICQIKWNRIRSIPFETVQIYFLSNVIGLLSSRNFATIATWGNDFSSL